jgi:hypothetical protein
MVQSVMGVDSLLTSSLVLFRLEPCDGVFVIETSDRRLPVDLARLYTEAEGEGDRGGRKIPALRALSGGAGASK